MGVFKLSGPVASRSASLTFDFLEAWLQTGGVKWANFDLVQICLWTKDLVLSSWAPMETNDINDDILSCEEKVIMKRRHTARDLYISKMGRKLLCYLKELRQATSTSIELVSNPSLLGLSGFDHLGGIVCRTFDVISGCDLASSGVIP
jgi:hypothetical protein